MRLLLLASAAAVGALAVSPLPACSVWEAASPSAESLILCPGSLIKTLATTNLDWEALEWLDVSDNAMVGSMVGTMPNVRALNVARNSLTGNLPTITSGNVVSADFSFNQFDGSSVFSVFSTKTSLVHLNIAFNSFSGDLDDSSGFNSLKSFDAAHNSFTGFLPSLSSSTSLKFLNLKNNQFEGNVPSSWALLTDVDFLDVSGNSLNSSTCLPVGMSLSSYDPNVHGLQLDGSIIAKCSAAPSTSPSLSPTLSPSESPTVSPTSSPIHPTPNPTVFPTPNPDDEDENPQASALSPGATAGVAASGSILVMVAGIVLFFRLRSAVSKSSSSPPPHRPPERAPPKPPGPPPGDKRHKEVKQVFDPESGWTVEETTTEYRAVAPPAASASSSATLGLSSPDSP